MGKLIVLNRKTKEYDYFIKYKRNRKEDKYTVELFYSHNGDWTNPGSKILTLKEENLMLDFKFEDKVDLKKTPYYTKNHMELVLLALDAISTGDKVKRKCKNMTFKILKM
jgi:hypothetical protein